MRDGNPQAASPEATGYVQARGTDQPASRHLTECEQYDLLNPRLEPIAAFRTSPAVPAQLAVLRYQLVVLQRPHVWNPALQLPPPGAAPAPPGKVTQRSYSFEPQPVPVYRPRRSSSREDDRMYRKLHPGSGWRP